MTEIMKCSRCCKELKQEDFCLGKNGEYLKTCNACRVYDKQRKDNNREAIKQQSREHYQTIKESKSEYAKQYKLDNYEKLYEKHKCDCGGKYALNRKADHAKTLKHKKHVEQSS